MKLGWCVSGAGMTARAVHEAYQGGLLTTGLSAVLLDRETPMRSYCSTQNIPCIMTEGTKASDRLSEMKSEFLIDWVGLTFNRLLSPDVISKYNGNIFNLHLAMLPKYPGFGPIKKTINAGDEKAGATVHFIDEGMDTGPIIFQDMCPVSTIETEETLGRKLFALSLPGVLQTVRSIESGALRPYSGERIYEVDSDLRRFGSEYCSRIFREVA